MPGAEMPLALGELAAGDAGVVADQQRAASTCPAVTPSSCALAAHVACEPQQHRPQLVRELESESFTT